MDKSCVGFADSGGGPDGGGAGPVGPAGEPFTTKRCKNMMRDIVSLACTDWPADPTTRQLLDYPEPSGPPHPDRDGGQEILQVVPQATTTHKESSSRFFGLLESV